MNNMELLRLRTLQIILAQIEKVIHCFCKTIQNKMMRQTEFEEGLNR